MDGRVQLSECAVRSWINAYHHVTTATIKT